MTEPSRGTPRTPSTRLNGVLDAEGLVTDAATAYAAEAAHALGSPELRVSPARLEANLRSLEVLTVNGRSATPWAPLSGFFPVSGGDWVRTHANSPWHRDRLCALLGLPDAANAIQLAAALAERDAAELEALAHAAGALLVRVRDASEAAAILDDAPPVRWDTPPSEAGRAGGAPGGSRADRPLRVLDLTTVIAGPTAGRALAAIGADVLRVDDPNRPELPDLFLDTSAGK
ncbi:CoA transferase, partial [Leucobacter sp. M11]|uniref:CoA transferase n=1 Tax=Leucobacter sp. M11 TaxID=2993565 RepID=UPI002D7FEE2B